MSCFFPWKETRSGTEKQCSHNLQSGHPAWWSADNYSILPAVNIFRLFRSKKRTGRGNQKCLKLKKIISCSTLRRPFLSSYTELYVAYSKLCRGKLFNRKRKPHTMSEKRHKIKKFANYQNIIVRNSPAFDCHVFVFSQDHWSMVFDVMRMISTQIPLARPLLIVCKLWEHRLKFI